MKNLLIPQILISITLAGCGSFVPTTKMDTLTPVQRQAMDQIEILNQTQLMNKKFKVLNIAEGNSCQNKLWDDPATRSGAINQLKYQAYEMQGDAITNIQCGGRERTSLRTNCWELISCTAEVIKFTN